MIRMRLEDAVRQATLFFLDEFLIERVLDEEPFDFLLCKDQWIFTLDVLLKLDLIELSKFVSVKVILTAFYLCSTLDFS